MGSELLRFRHNCQLQSGFGTSVVGPESPAGDLPAAAFRSSRGARSGPPPVAMLPPRARILLPLCASARAPHGAACPQPSSAPAQPSHHSQGALAPLQPRPQSVVSHLPPNIPAEPLPQPPPSPRAAASSVLPHWTHREVSCQLVLLPSEGPVCLKSTGVCRPTKHLASE